MKNLILSLVLLWSISASAFIDPPVFSQPIVANVAGTVTIRRGECDGFPDISRPIEYFLVPPNRLQLYVWGVHETNPLFCLSPVDNRSFVLPPLAAGEYQFELYVRRLGNPIIPIHNGPVANFTVVAQSLNLTPVPGLNLWGITALLIGMVGAAVFGVRSK